jgi:4-hydroxy-3-polyprenylbenzoate decarboxylase
LAYTDLRDWINTLHKAGELKRITQEIDPILEMAEIADRAAKSGRNTPKAGGPALLFENVKGHPGAKVLMNQFGSERRMKLALETGSLDDIADRIRLLLKPEMPTSFMDKLKMLPMLAEVGSFFPKVIPAKDAPCKQVIHRDEDVNLLDLPVLKTWPQDGGPFITLPCVITRDPRSSKRNVGMYRMQVYDRNTTGMHWQRQKVAAEHMRDRLRNAIKAGAPGLDSETWASARVDLMAITAGGTTAAASLDTINATTLTRIREDRMEIAVAIGTDPAITFSAIVPAPPDVEEYLIAGFLRQKPVELVKAETVDLEVPAHAEYILEGYVQLGELRTEGPFGDHTGHHRRQAPHGRCLDGQGR